MSGAMHPATMAAVLAAVFVAVFAMTWLLARLLLQATSNQRLRRVAPLPAAGALPVRRKEPGPAFLGRLRARRRRREAEQGFPDMLDLLVVCLEAGLGLDAAISRVGLDLALTAPVLAAELQQVTLALRAGALRQSALRDMAQRTGLTQLQSLASVLAQAERFGTGIAASLRQHAADLRLQRRLAAEERAARLSLKLLFPLIFCIFPALLLVLLGPASIQVRHAILPGAGS